MSMRQGMSIQTPRIVPYLKEIIMMNPSRLKSPGFATLALLFGSGTVHPYGGGGGSSGGCDEPGFFTESPADHSSVAALAGFSFIASNTDPTSLSITFNGNPVPADVTVMRNGDLQVATHLATPITQTGKVQIAVRAKNKDGCPGFKAYYVEVKP